MPPCQFENSQELLELARERIADLNAQLSRAEEEGCELRRVWARQKAKNRMQARMLKGAAKAIFKAIQNGASTCPSLLRWIDRYAISQRKG
jgi:hypothetical protein